MQELELLLQTHDWYHGRSDDMKAWRKGNEEFKVIHAMMKELGNTAEVTDLYSKYKPW